MSKKATAAKVPTVRSVDIEEPSARRTYQLTRSKIVEIPRFFGACSYTATRKSIKAAFKQLDKGQSTTFCDLEFIHNDGFTESLSHEAESIGRGRVRLGCQTFSARAIKTIRAWAGV